MVRKIGMCVLIAWSLTGVASAQVAMLTQVTGDVRVSGKDGDRGAVPFLKVNDGDTLTLTGNARVRMVYTPGGRQEVWTGAGPVEVGSAEGRSRSLKAEISQVPALILKQLEKTPAVGQHGKTGMVMLRSLDDLEAQDRLEDDYAKFRATAAADDTTPEVFLLSGLVAAEELGRASTFLDRLMTTHPGDAAYKALIDHFRTVVASRAADKHP